MAEEADALKSIPPYSKNDILRRFQFLSLRCESYLEEQGRVHPAWRLRYDPLVMLNVAQSAMDDIWRYKAYHLRDPEKRSDAVKRSAYFTKWITRFRPIYFARIPSAEETPELSLDKDDASLLMNEGYAIIISLSTIATDVGVGAIHLNPDFFTDFLYDLHYRNLSEDALLALYSIIRNTAKGDSVVMKVL